MFVQLSWCISRIKRIEKKVKIPGNDYVEERRKCLANRRDYLFCQRNIHIIIKFIHETTFKVEHLLSILLGSSCKSGLSENAQETHFSATAGAFNWIKDFVTEIRENDSTFIKSALWNRNVRMVRVDMKYEE